MNTQPWKRLFGALVPLTWALAIAPATPARAQDAAAAAETKPIVSVIADLHNLHKWDDSNGDTWDPFWADDDNLYSFNDDGRGFGPQRRNLALNKLVGNSVPALAGSPVNSMDYGKSDEKGPDNATWKACGQECIDGVFYCFVSRHVYGKDSKDPEMRQTTFNASLIKSADRGKTWTRPTAENYNSPMWPGPRFSAPYFFHYGKNGGSVAQDQADQYVYAISPNGFWNSGDDYVVGRVPRKKLPDLQAADWSYFTGGEGEGNWSADLNSAKPVLALKSKCGMTGPSYIPALKCYLMVIWYNPVVLKKWYNPTEMIYEFYQAPHPWGPWTAVGQPLTDKHIQGGHFYGPSICAKFQEPVAGGMKVWMFTSGCPFEDKPTGLYKAWAIPLILETASPAECVAVNDNDKAIRYTGTWKSITNRKQYDYKGDIHQAAEKGASAERAFVGSGVDVIAPKQAGLGEMEIYIDGQLRETVSLSLTNFPPLSRVTVFRARGLVQGPHTIKIVSKSEAPIALDAFCALGPPRP